MRPLPYIIAELTDLLGECPVPAIARAWFLVGVFTLKGLPRATWVVFLSGNRAPAESRDGNAGHLYNFRIIFISFILKALASCRYWPPWCKTNGLQEAAMIHRTLFLHYRLVREAVTVLVTIGTALLFSYLILWAKL
jgi:hypothetical protein